MSTRAIDPIGASRLHDVWAAYRAASVKPARESYTAHCVRNAAQAFHAQLDRLNAQSVAENQAQRDAQTALQVRAQAANDLGTIQGVLALQGQRYAVSQPPLRPRNGRDVPEGA